MVFKEDKSYSCVVLKAVVYCIYVLVLTLVMSGRVAPPRVDHAPGPFAYISVVNGLPSSPSPASPVNKKINYTQYTRWIRTLYNMKMASYKGGNSYKFRAAWIYNNCTCQKSKKTKRAKLKRQSNVIRIVT